MNEFEQDIRSLAEKTESNRQQFLRTDLETCFIAIEKARLELSLGNTQEGEKEFTAAQHGAEVVEHFLGQGRGPVAEIEGRLAELKASLKSLRSELDIYPR